MTRNLGLVVGSLRKESWTRKVAHALKDLAPTSMHLDEVEIGNLPLYNQDFDADKDMVPREWAAFRDRLRDVDGVIFATPEYNRSVPGVLKNAIDVGSRPYGSSIWAGKPAGVISVSPGMLGAFGAQHHLRQSLVFLDMPAMQQPEMYISQVDKAFDKNGTLTSEPVRDLLKKFITSFDAWIDRLSQPRPAARKSA